MTTIVTRKPRNASLRFQQYLVQDDLAKKAPEKSLTAPLKKTGGRNAYGRITSRHRGGGAKKLYRIIDFKRMHKDVSGKIVAFEYDPNRNVPIALINYINGAKGYILKPEGLKVGDAVLASEKAEAKVGNCLPLRYIPVGFFVHNVELYPLQGGKFARSAGSSVQLVNKEKNLAILKMPSGELRTVSDANWATVGSLSNADFKNVVIGKAGRTRHLGIRPTVRGMAMNPVDHPHGGGEGRSKSGSHPVSPWGKGCKGTRTRRKKSTAILKRRK
ncbi:50S ribosomal protein L2 [Candidatus Dependentiae bacterium]|nr:50S ribosomal protein L2 [Candidatus Dependentiae bacterium]